MKIKKLIAFSLCFSLLIVCSLNAIELKTVAQDSNPKYFLDKNKTMQGLLPDIIRALEKADSELKFTGYNKFMPFKRMEMNLEKGKIDLFFGLSRNASREKKYFYPDIPLYKVQHVVAVLAGDTVKVKNFQDIADLGNKGRILTLVGTSTHKYIQKNAKKQNISLFIDSGGKNVETLLLKLLARRGRFAYYHSLGIVSTRKKMKKESEITILPASFRDYYHWVGFSKNCPESKRKRVIAALEKIRSNGELQAITDNYLKF